MKRPALSRLPLLVALAGVAGWIVLQWPLDTPDASSPPVGNSIADINYGRSIGQSFVAKRDGLDRISLVLGVEQPTDQLDITFIIRPDPAVEPVREIHRSLSQLPKGNVGNWRPDTWDEKWYTFDFDPIPDSAGRKLYFAVEGRDVPCENSVRTLVMFHNGYRDGQAYLAGEPVNAHIVFRAYSRGHVSDLLPTITTNLTANRAGILASPITYMLLGLLYLSLTWLLVVLARRGGSRGG